MKRVLVSMLLGVMLLAVAGTVSAQTAVNPTIVSFAASADHSALGLDGQPIVTRYELRVYLPTIMTTVVVAQDLGKPTPDASHVITTDLGPTLAASLVKNTAYIAEVAAIGPSGEGVSGPSNPFGFAGPPAAPGVPAMVKK